MPTSEQVESKHFLEYMHVLQSRKEIVLAVSFLVIVIGVLVTFSMDKKYKASTRMTVRSVQADVPVFDNKDEVLFAGHSESFNHASRLFRPRAKTIYELAAPEGR